MVGGEILHGELGPPLPEEEVQLLLVAEIEKEQGLADARFGRDLTHGAALIAVLREHPEARVEDTLLLFLREMEEFLVHISPPDCCGQ